MDLLTVTWCQQQAHSPVMCSDCSLQEEMQKAAFQALQLQKDAVHGYIRNQVCACGWRQVGLGLSPASAKSEQPQHSDILCNTSQLSFVQHHVTFCFYVAHVADV